MVQHPNFLAFLVVLVGTVPLFILEMALLVEHLELHQDEDDPALCRVEFVVQIGQVAIDAQRYVRNEVHHYLILFERMRELLD